MAREKPDKQRKGHEVGDAFSESWNSLAADTSVYNHPEVAEPSLHAFERFAKVSKHCLSLCFGAHGI
jgi:hypothetical protein